MLPTGPEQTLELVLKVRFRYEKGQRDQGNPDNPKHKWVTFREDRICRGRCPVTHFLGLAFADNAFIELKSPDDLYKLELGASTSNAAIELKFKDSVEDILIFRHCTTNGQISPTQAMTYNVTAKELGELALRAGFRDWLRLYSLRRGAANAFEGKNPQLI